tara:strand:+ start:72 stop:245 length:174 start_codon:yes stop_codon:yes gene_type:complete
MMVKTLYLLCFLISMVSAGAGAAQEAKATDSAKPALKWFIFREDCYEKFVNKQDFSD